MPRKLPRVSALTLRKDLLIAESELNRAQLTEEWEAATEWHRTLNSGARMAGSMASAAGLLMSGFQAFRRKRKPSGGEGSWLTTVIKGVALIASLCEAVQSHGDVSRGEIQAGRKK